MSEKDKNRELILEIDRVEKSYREHRSLFSKSGQVLKALDGVSLNIKKGEIFGLVGASGSGKTTLGRLALRLEEADAGSIRFNKEEIGKLRGVALKSFRKNMQLIPQDPYQSLNPYMSVFDFVAEPLIIHHIGREAAKRKELVADSLRAAGLAPPADYFGRYPHQLSGGQRQRTAIARAMVLSPDFVIADEPTSMLDATISFTIFKLLEKISRERDVTLLFITHNLAAARFLCDRIGVIYQGRIVESGPAESVIKNPRSDYTRTLIEAQPGFSFVRNR